MQRRLVAREVTVKLNRVETQIDQTLIAAGALLSALPDARERANLSAVVGQDALDLVAEATVILAQARGKFVEAHHALARTSKAIGVDPRTTGSGGDKTPTGLETERTEVRHPRAA
jgi:hypothetical protein